MNTITVSKKSTTNDLVTIPRKEYEAWLEFKKIKEFKPTPAQRRALLRAENNLKDPDAGLELTQAAIRRLKKSIWSKKSGKYRNLSEVIKKYSR